MLNKDIIFLFYLTNSATGACYWLDANRHIQQTPINVGPINDMRIATPGGWESMELGFMRNMTYMGFNRSFSMPQQIVKDAAYILRILFYTNAGRGTETPLTIVVLKFNDDPLPGEGNYELYYKGALDLPNWDDDVQVGVKVNCMEGGVLQVVKAFENTIVEIPCDGSIEENIKANLDGVLYEDTLRYQFIPMQGAGAENNQGVSTIAMSLLDQDGDSFGVQNGNQQYEKLNSTYPQQSGNFTLQFNKTRIANISGFITVKPFNSDNDARFNLGWFTSLAKGNILLGGGHSGLLVPALGPIPDVTSGGTPIPSGSTLTHVTNQTTFYFSQSITLAPGENIFFYWTDIAKGSSGGKNMSIVGGQCNIKYISQADTTYPWGLSLYDVFRLVWKSICDLASKTYQPISFAFDSDLLKSYLNYFITSGDALRASGDPTYHKFFNALQTNPNFPNINETFSYGPVIKTSLRECFEAAKVLCFGAMGNQQLMGQNESLFFEMMDYVFNSTGPDTFDLGEVSDLSVSVNRDFEYNILQIGYPNPSYDQKSGKYEPNTTAEWQLPFKSFTGKILKLICPWRSDAYGIERLRSNIDSTSSTRNGSDSSIFVINIDRSKSVWDMYKSYFTSPIPDTTQSNCTNAKLTVFKYQQPTATDKNQGGGYFLQGNDPSIFVLNQQDLVNTVKTFRVDIGGNLIGNPANLLTGTPADTVTIKLFINGVVNNTWTFPSTGTITNWSISGYLVVRQWNYKDCIYLTMATSANGTAQVNTGQLQMDSGGAYWQASVVGLITAQPGTANNLIAFPAVASSLDGHGQEKVSYGFQYWQFNSIVINNNFNYEWTIQGFINGSTALHGEADFFHNGKFIDSPQFPAHGPTTAFSHVNGGNLDLVLGDLFFITAGCPNLFMWISGVSITFTSTQTRAYSPYRVRYDVLNGMPNLALDANGVPDSSLPGAPYNIEGLTPKRLFELWFPFLKAICFDQVPGTILFSTLSKNKYLSTTYQGKTITEAADVQTSDMGEPLFIPRTLKARLETPHTFQKVLTGAANAHMRMTYGGVPIFSFGMQMKQRSAYRDAQEWVLVLSPKTPLSTFIDLNNSGLNYLDMPSNSLFYSFLSPFQWYPEGQVLDPQYHTYSRNLFPFSKQITRWINTRDYKQPWQLDDMISLQFITKGLGAVRVDVYKCGQDGEDPLYTFDMNLITTAAINATDYYCFQKDIDPAVWDPGIYAMNVVGGASGSTSSIVCQAFDLRTDWPDTLKFKLKSSVNKQSMIFTDTGYSPVVRFHGTYDNRFQQKYIGQFYKDQNQAITILNAVPYEITKLWIGFEYGVPDWVLKKVSRMMLLDGTTIESERFSINEGAEWENIAVEGAPMKYSQIDIRPVDNLNGISVPATMLPDDTSMVATTDALGFGPNAYNESKTTDPEIVEILIS